MVMAGTVEVDGMEKLRKRIERLMRTVLVEVADDQKRITIVSKLVEVRNLLDE